MSVAISNIVGSAYVNIHAVTDKVEKQVSRAFDKLKDVQVSVSADISAALSQIEEIVDTIEAVEANLKLDIDTKSMDDTVRKISDKQASIPVDVDVAAAEQEIDDFVNENRDIAIAVNPDTTYASSRLAWLGRTRYVEYAAKINKKAFGQTAASLASLSGGTYVLDKLKSMNEYLLDIGQHAPKIAGVGLAIGGIGSMVMAAVSNILTLGGSLAQVAGVGLVLPGIFAGMAVGMMTMVIALKDAGKYLEDLKHHFTETKQIISDNFWAPATQPIKEFVNGIMPQFKDSIAGVSTALGGFAAATANAFSQWLTPSILSYMMENLRSSIDIASGAMNPFIESIMTLGMVGSEYLPRLAEWFVRISTNFNEWLQGADSDGRLRLWIENGIDAMYDLGKIVGETSRIFYALYQAAEEAGGATLEVLGGALERIADIVEGPAFQTTLIQVFRGSHAAMEGMLSALIPLGNALSVLGPSIETSLGLAGSAIGILATNLSNMLGQVSVGEGLVNMFTGIKAGAEGLAPAMGPLGDMVGALGTVIGALAANTGPLLAAVLTALAPPVTTLLEAIAPLIPILGESLIGAVETLAPTFQELATILADSLPAIVGFITGLVDIAAAIADGLGPALPGIVVAFIGLAGAIKAVSAVSGALGFVGTLGAAFTKAGTSASLFGLKVSTTSNVSKIARVAMTGLGTAIKGVGAAMTVLSGPVGLAIAAVAALVAGFVLAYNKIGWFKDFVDMCVDGVVAAFQWLKDGAVSIFGSIGEAFSKVGDALATAGDWIMGVMTTIGAGISTAVTFIGNVIGFLGVVFEAVFTGIFNIAKIIFDLIITLISGGIEVIKQVWEAGWTFFSAIFTAAWTQIVEFFAPIIEMISTGISVGMTLISVMWNAAWQGILDFFIGIWNGLIAFFTPIFEFVNTIITQALVFISVMWNAAWQGIFDFFVMIWNAVVAFFAPIIAGIQTYISNAVTFISVMWNTTWQGIFDFFSMIWNAIVAFLAPIIAAISSVITSNIQNISNIWNAIWGGISSFFSAIWGIITGAASSSVEWLSGIISGGIEAISSVWTTIWDGVSSFFSQVWEGIVAAASGFVTAVQDTFNDVMEFIGGLKDKILAPFSGAASWLSDIGGDIMRGLSNGFSGAIGDIMAEVNNVGQKIKDGFTNFFGIKSPSRVMRDEVGKMLGAGLAIGMEKSIKGVEKASARLSNAAMIDDLSMSFGANTPSVPRSIPKPVQSASDINAAGVSADTASGGVNIHVHPSAGLDEVQVGKAAAHEIFWQSMQSTNRQ